MDVDDFAPRIDHTVLGPATTFAEVAAELDLAEEYGTNFATYPCYISAIHERAPEVTVVAAIGFPHGQHTTSIKRTEAVTAVEAGADEVDMMINVGSVKAGEWKAVREDVEAVVDAVTVPVKVIVEAPLLSKEELHASCQAAVDAGADFVKTSTGFVEGGATVEDVALMSDYLPTKASGGVGSWSETEAMFDAGADRIGASSGIAIVQEFLDAEDRSLS